MKRKDAARKEGTCPRDAPKDEKCASCRSKKGACLVAARIAAGNALTSPDEPSTSKPRTTQPDADSDMDIEPPNTRPSRERKAPERIEVDELRSRATGKRRPDSCCPSHTGMDAEPSTSEPAPKPKFAGPMDKYLSDKRVEAAVNRAVKSITDNPADLERELRDFAQTGEDWRQKSMTLEQENEAIRKKLDKVTKELEKVKKEAAFEIGDFSDAEDHQAILKAIVGNGYRHDESGRRLLRMHAAAIVCGDCIDLDFARCKEEAHCGAPQERALTAVQFEQDEKAMARCKSKRDASSRARSFVSPTMTSRPSHACLS